MSNSKVRPERSAIKTREKLKVKHKSALSLLKQLSL